MNKYSSIIIDHGEWKQTNSSLLNKNFTKKLVTSIIMIYNATIFFSFLVNEI